MEQRYCVAGKHAIELGFNEGRINHERERECENARASGQQQQTEAKRKR